MTFTTPHPINEPILNYEPGSAEKTAIKSELIRQSSSCKEIPIRIGGELGSGTKWTNVVIPHDHATVLAKCQEVVPSEVVKAIAVCTHKQKEWSRMHWRDRVAIFLKAADLISGPYRAEINAATMLGQSKTVYQAEIEAACELADFLRFNARFYEELQMEAPYSPKNNWNSSEMRGLEGFVFAICPFNFTAINVNLAAAPLMMGCSVLWKPAPTAMLAADVARRVLEEAGLPEGVCTLVHGDPQMIGDIALKHPDLAGVHFTGSTAVFNHIWKTVGQYVDLFKGYPRIVGETGGKDFVFAHNSADIENLVYSLVRGAYEYQGQKC